MSSRNDSDSGLGCVVVIVIIALVSWFKGCGDDKKSKSSNTQTEHYLSTSSTNDYSYGLSPADDAEENGVVEIVEEDPEVAKYKDNYLSTGTHPYKNESNARGSDSEITIQTSTNSKTDVVVILKHNDRMVRNTYIRAGGSTTFSIPNGTYQIFFYYGKGWNPNKEMPNGLRGGFVSSESFAKDSPQTLDYEALTYELIYQTNGNFMTQSSSANEIF